jgi:hypothetical protein
VLPPGIQWAERRNAVGAVIRHMNQGRYVTDLLFVVRLLASHATTTGVEVWYRVGTQSYEFHTPFGLTVLRPGAKCP